MPSATMEKYILAQVKYWQSQQKKINQPEAESVNQFITISREYGCSGLEIGQELIGILNGKQETETPWAVYDRQVLDRVMTDMGLTEHLVKTLTDDARNILTNLIQTSFSKFPPQVAVYQKLAETIRMLAANGRVVIVGRAGNVITRGMKGGYHARIIATMDFKIETVMKNKNVSRKEAEKLVTENSARRTNYIKEYVNFDVDDPHNYDITINLTKHSVKDCAGIIVCGMKVRGLL